MTLVAFLAPAAIGRYVLCVYAIARTELISSKPTGLHCRGTVSPTFFRQVGRVPHSPYFLN